VYAATDDDDDDDQKSDIRSGGFCSRGTTGTAVSWPADARTIRHTHVCPSAQTPRTFYRRDCRRVNFLLYVYDSYTELYRTRLGRPLFSIQIGNINVYNILIVVVVLDRFRIWSRCSIFRFRERIRSCHRRPAVSEPQCPRSPRNRGWHEPQTRRSRGRRRGRHRGGRVVDVVRRLRGHRFR